MPKERQRKDQPSEKRSMRIVATGQPTVPWTGLDCSAVGLRVLTRQFFRMEHLTVLYLSKNNLSYIDPEMSHLKNLEILDLSYNKLRALPPEMGLMKSLKELLLYNNMIQTLPFELGNLFRIHTLGLQGNPLNDPIRSYAQEGTESVMTYLLDNAPVAVEPPERVWAQPKSAGDTKFNPQAGTFTVLCFNVLSDKYATRNLYGYCPSWALDWNYRRELILKEIETHGCDVVMLQEVETGAFYNYFCPELQSRGYDGVFRAKSRARNMSKSDRKSVDGCATFFRTSKFSLKTEHLIEFERLATRAGAGSEDMLNRVMPKDNIALGVMLEYQPTKRPVFFANCHLTWDPAFADVKLIQTMMLVNEIKNLLNETEDDFTRVPIMLGGDFNSLPESGVYEYLSKGRVARDHADLFGGSYGAFFDKVGMSHPLALKSTYQDELPYTNYTFDFTGVIDYLWCSARHLVPVAILGPANEEYMKDSFVGCPNAHFPSDHISLVAEYGFTQ